MALAPAASAEMTQALAEVAACCEALSLRSAPPAAVVQVALQWVGLLARRGNLVGDASPLALVREHVCEALALLAALERLGSTPARILEVGAGAGLTLTTLLAALPEATGVAVEPRARRADCIELCADAVGIAARLRVERRRWEDMSAAVAPDLAIARAVFAPTRWLALAAVRVAPGGLIAVHRVADGDLDAQAPPPGHQGLREVIVVAVPGRPRHVVALWQVAGDGPMT